ncbi:MAG: hypothetical protein E6J64_19840 [Deltaproteobacteria bacterium]|nr:MAG: hypothetical protein E6J64_19840 [Deltaproteobacteria bacterium]
MGELRGGSVVAVLEAERLGERAHVRLAAGEERPVLRARAIQAFHRRQVPALRLAGRARRVLRIEAERDALVVLAELQARVVEPLDQALHHQAAEHRALEVDERDHHRLAVAEEVLQRHVVVEGVVEAQSGGDRVAEALDDVDALVPDRLERRVAVSAARRRGIGGRREHGDEQRGDHGFFPCSCERS